MGRRKLNNSPSRAMMRTGATSWATKRSIELLEAVEAGLVQSCEHALLAWMVIPTSAKSAPSTRRTVSKLWFSAVNQGREFRTTHTQ